MKRQRAPVPQPSASPGSVSQITQSPRVPELHFHLLVTDLASEGGSSWETAISPPPRSRTPARQRAKAQSAKRTSYTVRYALGRGIIKITAADRPTSVLGQLIIFGAIVVVALVELTLWLVN